MRLGSAGLAALLWSTIATLTGASPIADGDGRPMPIVRPRQAGTGVTPTPTPTTAPTTPTTAPTPTDAEATTTVTITTTVGGGGGGGVITASTVVFRTITTTILVTSTTFQTTTITSNDVATATVTNYVTSTVLAKRSLQVLPLDGPVPAPAPQITPAADDFRRRAFVEKRALVTVVVTVQGSAAGVSTVFNTRTSTVVFTTTSNTDITSVLTSTQFNNAQTTVTVESTLTITSTTIDTGAPSTVDTGPTSGRISTATPTGDAQGGGGGGGDSGLSTGAKTGIGVAVGIVGLAALLGIGWWAYKRYKATRPSRRDLDDMRAYDPNGPSPLNEPVGMSETGGYGGAGYAAAGAGTTRRQPVPKHQLSPPSQSVSPFSNQTVSPVSGHDAGYGRPPTGGAQELGGTRIMPAEMGGDEVAEMGDSQPRPQQPLQHQPAPGRPYGSGPVPDTYEMPSERYR